MEDFRITKEQLQKHTGLAIAFLTVCLIVLYQREKAWQFVDCFFTTGMLFVLTAALRFSRWLGLFDLSIYGFKKLLEVFHTPNYRRSESRMGDYADYRESASNCLVISEPFLVGTIFVAISLLLL